jgi:hypothetical protein
MILSPASAIMNGRENTRGLASIDPSASKQRHPTGEVRNGGGTGAADGAMSRAQKFEDEKRRIIQSCFSKRDADGACMLPSLITVLIHKGHFTADQKSRDVISRLDDFVSAGLALMAR